MIALLLVAGLASPEALPEFSAVDLQGRSVDRAALAGKPLLINFWASWCKPCIDEMPIINAIQAQFGPKGLVVVGVSFDEDPDVASRTAERLGLRSFNLVDPGGHGLGPLFKVKILPTTVLYHPDGRQLWRKDEVLGEREAGLGAALVAALRGVVRDGAATPAPAPQPTPGKPDLAPQLTPGKPDLPAPPPEGAP